MQTGTRKKAEKKTRRRRFTVKTAIYAVFAVTLLAYVGSTLLLGSHNTRLAVKNQDLLGDIDERSAAINRLEGEITELQEKNRVLGMLDGQVSDNGGNVYYYDAQ